VGLEAIQEMEYQMKNIRQKIKEEHDQKKSYADAHRVDCSYNVGDRVFLRVKLHKSQSSLETVLKYLLGLWDPVRLWKREGPSLLIIVS
jgi:Tfp pilus assembly pilus retraction ATPase PilT